MTGRLVAGLAAAAVACALATCGDDDNGAGGPAAKIVITTTDPSASKVTLSAPSSVEAGPVRIVLRNQGDTLHDAQLLRVDGKHSPAEVADVLELTDDLPKPRWLHPSGGLAAVGAGRSASVLQVLAPGSYVIADTQERTGDTRITNAIKGGIFELEVVPPAADDDALDPAKARITAGERGFEAAGLRAGRQRVTFTNEGSEPHQVAVIPMPSNGKFEAGLQRVLDREEGTRWVPVDVPAARATAVLEPGDAQTTEMTIGPGRYAMLCFVSDWLDGGEPQWSDGMASELRVESGDNR